jgi:uncharacterized protein (TIGR02246 family)
MISTRQLLLSIVAITIGTALPGPAQQNRLQDLTATAAAVIAERSELYNKKDAGGIAAEFTADATFVELLPILEVMHGKAEIQKHYQQLFDAGATNFSQKITQVELNGNDTGVMAGDYTVFANGKTITGHWFEILRQEAGTWKTAVHVFARPEPIIEWQLEFPQVRPEGKAVTISTPKIQAIENTYECLASTSELKVAGNHRDRLEQKCPHDREFSNWQSDLYS